MKFELPGFAGVNVVIGEDDCALGMEHADGHKDTYVKAKDVPGLKRDAATAGTSFTGTMISGATGASIASLGSIGIAGLGGAIAVPLFPVIGVGVAAAGIAGSICAAAAVWDELDTE